MVARRILVRNAVAEILLDLRLIVGAGTFCGLETLSIFDVEALSAGSPGQSRYPLPSKDDAHRDRGRECRAAFSTFGFEPGRNGRGRSEGSAFYGQMKVT